MPGLPLRNAKAVILTWALPHHNGSDVRTLTVAVLSALLLAGPAAAHVSVRPALLESGRETLLRVELPGLRPGQEPTALDVSGPGVRELTSELSDRLGDESRWRVRVRVETEPGPLPLVLLVRYSDGRSVTVRQTLTVIPARADEGAGAPTPAIAGALAALLAGTVALLLVRRSRRRAC